MTRQISDQEIKLMMMLAGHGANFVTWPSGRKVRESTLYWNSNSLSIKGVHSIVISKNTINIFFKFSHATNTEEPYKRFKRSQIGYVIEHFL